MVGDVRLNGRDDIAGDIGNRGLNAGGRSRHHGCKYQSCKQCHNANGKLTHEPGCGAVSDLLDIEGAESKSHINGPHKAQKREARRNEKGFVDLLFFLDCANTLEINLVCHAAGKNCENPQHAGGNADIVNNRALHIQQRAALCIEIGNNI